jgi:hypothetical protein
MISIKGKIPEIQTQFMEMDFFFAVSAVSYCTNTFHNVRDKGEILMQVRYAFR